jgi:Na+/H+ antiporter NhaD/arsenite permease-like protein
MDFVVNLAPVCAIILVVHVFMMKWVYRADYAKNASPEQFRETLERLRRENRITDGKLLAYGGAVLGLVIFMFLCHGALDMPVAVPALMGAAVLLVVRDRLEMRRMRASHEDPAPTEQAHGILRALEKEVEWPTLIFFAFLFVIVGAADRVGLIERIALLVRDFSGGNLTTAMLLTLWVSAIASAFIDNIPFTATMLPLLATLGAEFGPEGRILWWALALGACLGGNGTVIGASANVVTAGLAEKAGVPISFWAFMRVGFPAMLVQVTIAMLWLLFVDPLLFSS